MIDTRKPEDYFYKYITDSLMYISDYEDIHSKLLMDGQVESDDYKRMTYTLFQSYLHVTIARYSFGQIFSDYGEIEQIYDLLAILNKFNMVNLQDSNIYMQVLWFVSFLRIDEYFDMIESLKTKLSGKDRMIDMILGIPDSKAPCLHPMQNACDMKTTESFLKNWYQSMKEKNLYFVDTHLLDNGGYFGYSAFESLALYKLRKMKHTKDNVYFPSNM